MVWQYLLVIMLLCFSNRTLAGGALVGQWQVVYEYEGQQSTVVYCIYQLGPFLQGAIRTDSRDNVVTGPEHQGASPEREVVLDQIEFQNNQGHGLYQLHFNRDVSQLPATLTLLDENTLKVEYAYFGFNESEIWTRVTSP